MKKLHVAESDEPCDGQHSDHCQRFKGLKVVSQSAHDRKCTWQDESDGTIGARTSLFAAMCCRKPRNKPEPKSVWDEKSYRSIEGARAVSLAETDPQDGPIKFCKVSNKTLAISHVWSHGQGGRPETGINRCLHARYVRIARNLDCDSYWIDTTCIPCEHELRKRQSCILMLYLLTLVQPLSATETLWILIPQNWPWLQKSLSLL